ncbi:hypothetical protein [Massilia sp. AB1]|uniref:hypothetical protein n=1 Tax=Massilia sp. AB1 TaxID=2823371 RepID=UPI001B836D5A|nr:hypothetical protein [Massilia sp. AB1]MBQ5939863.1 hypothetical protein [Massilia sp. AB1]
MKFASKAERLAAPVIASLGGRPCVSFAPYMSPIYQDASGEQLEGKPDFVIPCAHGPVFIELKDGSLNNHYTCESSREALAAEYMRILRSPTNGMSHTDLSTALHGSGRAGYLATLAEGFNHSLWKLLALQAQHGWRHYIVCFIDNPKPDDAERYANSGLIWCTLKMLPQMLIRIELEAEGVSIPFVHQATKFGCTVEFDDGTAGAAELRSHFLETVTADRVAAAEARAKAAADFAAGIMPY